MNEWSDFFTCREEPTEEIVQLLESVTLGTDGAHYRHLDTRDRISQLDNPLFLSLERNGRILGNITFCKRGVNWYIRYFAFDGKLHASGRKKSNAKEGMLKSALHQFFERALGERNDAKVETFYAYIDPRNAKSLWMSETFGFETIGNAATQTFSRITSKKTTNVQKSTDWNLFSELVINTYGNQQLFFTEQTKKPPFYYITDDSGKVLAFAKITRADWEIKRLPGSLGSFLVKALPYIPFLRKLIRPKKHSFVVPEAVYVEKNDPKLLTDLFEGILCHEQKTVILWWVDEKAEIYQRVRNTVKWGLLDRIVGVNKVNIVSKTGMSNSSRHENAMYISGFDFV